MMLFTKKGTLKTTQQGIYSVAFIKACLYRKILLLKINKRQKIALHREMLIKQ